MTEPVAEKPRPGRPKDPLRRQRIVDAAGGAFSAKGYAGTSLAEVATSLGLSKAAVLHHFTSKEALYFEVLSQMAGELGGMVAEAVTGDAPFEARLDRLGETVVEYLGSRPGAGKLVLTELIGRGPFAQGPGKAAVTAALNAVVTFLSLGMKQGAIAPQPPEHLAMSIIGIHLLWFSTDFTGTLIDDDPHAPQRVAQRKAAVLRSVRALCLGEVSANA